MAVDTPQHAGNMVHPVMPQPMTQGAWYSRPEGIVCGQPFRSQPRYPPHVPQWANMPEFQFVQGTGPVPLPPFQHPIQVSATSNLDDTHAKVIGEFHETSTILSEENRPPPTAAVQVQELDQLDPMLRPFIQLASRPENSSAKAKAQPQPDPVLQSHASSRASNLIHLKGQQGAGDPPLAAQELLSQRCHEAQRQIQHTADRHERAR